MVKEKETPKEEKKTVGPVVNEQVNPATIDESKNPEKKVEKVEVDKNVLQQVLDKQKDQDAQIEKLTKDNERLTYTADKSRLALYDSRNSEELIHTYRVGMWDDKYVIGWKTVKDDAVYDTDKKVFTYVQITKLFLDAGEGKDPIEVELDMLIVSRGMKKVTAELVRESKTNEGIFKTLKFKDGREIEFDVRFLNP